MDLRCSGGGAGDWDVRRTVRILVLFCLVVYGDCFVGWVVLGYVMGFEEICCFVGFGFCLFMM